MSNSFGTLGLTDPIVRALSDKGYEKPTPIQQKAIPLVIEGSDVLAAAQTGTGKTAAFTLPIMHRLASQKTSGRRKIKALILTPTRELAAQIKDNIELYGKNLNLKQTVVFGGVKINPQISVLKSGVDILIATPGRLLDLVDQGKCSLNDVEVLVLDEADRMLDMGFVHEMRKLVRLLPKKRQNLLFSATFSKEIRVLTKEFLVNPKTVEVASNNAAAETVTQRAYRCDATSKANLAVKIISEGGWDQVLVFVRTKHGADRLTKHLIASKIKSAAIHGNKSQNARVKALDNFKNKQIKVLVATDIAARGVDISQLPCVVNYELPNVPADYVHRIGRTGRAGQEGIGISFVSNDERAFFKDIERLIKQNVKLEDVEGFVPEEWPARMPTANEVQKARDERRKEMLKARGPRKQTRNSGKPSGKSSEKSFSKNNKSSNNRSNKSNNSNHSSGDGQATSKKSSHRRRYRGNSRPSA